MKKLLLLIFVYFKKLHMQSHRTASFAHTQTFYIQFAIQCVPVHFTQNMSCNNHNNGGATENTSNASELK